MGETTRPSAAAHDLGARKETFRVRLATRVRAVVVGVILAAIAVSLIRSEAGGTIQDTRGASGIGPFGAGIAPALGLCAAALFGYAWALGHVEALLHEQGFVPRGRSQPPSFAGMRSPG